ncbi:MAG: hypothetical protein ACFFCR_11995 [Promethearchaeota archaeon]
MVGSEYRQKVLATFPVATIASIAGITALASNLLIPGTTLPTTTLVSMWTRIRTATCLAGNWAACGERQ